MREKIIVGLMVLVVAYFIFDFFWTADPPAPPPTAAHDAALAMASDLQQALAAGEFEPPEHLIAGLTELRSAAWSPDAFVEAGWVLPESEAGDQEEAFAAEELQAVVERLVYSGFLEMSGRRLAVINGQEYAVGDEVNERLRLLVITAQYLELALGEHQVRLPIVDLD